MISCQHGEIFVVRKHALKASLNALKTEATIAPDPDLNSSQ